MNRDDRLSRPSAIPPQNYRVAGVNAVYPSEHPARTWIAANEFGITLALLNWNRPKLTSKLHSRGGVILAIIGSNGSATVADKLGRLDLRGAWPFRLFGFFGLEHRVHEWRWDGSHVTAKSHKWQRNHWFSSGLSDLKATRQRRRIFDSAAHDSIVGTLVWLRKLHRQHGREPGPFSVCVHREDAATLSYTEVVLHRGSLSMRYAAGQPCASLRADVLSSVALAISRGAEAIRA